MEPGIELVIRNRTGLHARPAKEFVNLAKKFEAEIRVHHAGRKANGKSLVSLLTLGVKSGSSIRIEAEGVDREEALRALSEAIAAGLGEGVVEGDVAAPAAPSTPPPPAAHPVAPPPAVPADPRRRRGVAAAPGLAIGPIHQLRATAAAAPGAIGTRAEERARLEGALAASRVELLEVRDRLQRMLVQGGAAEAGIFEVHVEILEDPELVAGAMARIEAGEGAAAAWKATLDARAASVSQLDDALLAARAADLGDVAERVLRVLAGGASATVLPAAPGRDRRPRALALADHRLRGRACARHLHRRGRPHLARRHPGAGAGSGLGGGRRTGRARVAGGDAGDPRRRRRHRAPRSRRRRAGARLGGPGRTGRAEPCRGTRRLRARRDPGRPPRRGGGERGQRGRRPAGGRRRRRGRGAPPHRVPVPRPIPAPR